MTVQLKRIFGLAISLFFWAKRCGVYHIRRQLPDVRTRFDDGLCYQLSRSNALDFHLRSNNGVYSKAIPALLEVAKGNVCIDVGANAGYWTIPCATRFSLVIALEPDPQVCEKLKNNVKLNPSLASRIRILEKAAGAHVGLEKLNIRRSVDDGSRLNIGLSSTAADDLIEDCITVDITTLDTETRSISEKIALIKIDVEGLESKVLSGSTSILTRHRPIVFWEASRTLDLKTGSSNVITAFELLSQFQYKHLVFREGGHATPVASSVEISNWGDVDIVSCPDADTHQTLLSRFGE